MSKADDEFEEEVQEEMRVQEWLAYRKEIREEAKHRLKHGPRPDPNAPPTPLHWTERLFLCGCLGLTMASLAFMFWAMATYD